MALLPDLDDERYEHHWFYVDRWEDGRKKLNCPQWIILIISFFANNDLRVPRGDWTCHTTSLCMQF